MPLGSEELCFRHAEFEMSISFAEMARRPLGIFECGKYFRTSIKKYDFKDFRCKLYSTEEQKQISNFLFPEDTSWIKCHGIQYNRHPGPGEQENWREVTQKHERKLFWDQ